MQTITCASGKGGSGRSTTILALAVYVHQLGHKVAILDMDPGQGVLQRWAALREKPGPELVTPDDDRKLSAHLKALAAAGTEYLFIDTAPAVDADQVVEAGVKFSDLCLIPVRPSFFDVMSISAVIEMCREHDRRFAIVMVDVDDRKAWKGLVDSAAKVLGKMAEKPLGTLLRERLSHNVAFVNAHTRGLTGGEINGEAKLETADLWGVVQAMLPKRGRHG